MVVVYTKYTVDSTTIHFRYVFTPLSPAELCFYRCVVVQHLNDMFLAYEYCHCILIICLTPGEISAVLVKLSAGKCRNLPLPSKAAVAPCNKVVYCSSYRVLKMISLGYRKDC